MKTTIKHFLIALGTVSLTATLTFADSFPPRKPGLWNFTTELPGGKNIETKQCIDAATDADMMRQGEKAQEAMGGNCTKNEIKKVDSSYVSEITCTQKNQMKFKAKTTFSGDFNSQFSAVTESEFDPPIQGANAMKMQVDARWIGPCGKDMKPGDIILPDGSKQNYSDAFKAAALKNVPPKKKSH